MRISLWIAGSAVIALSAVDAAIGVQNRAVGALTRAAIRRMDTPVQPSDSTSADSSTGLMDFIEEVLAECVLTVRGSTPVTRLSAACRTHTVDNIGRTPTTAGGVRPVLGGM
ncbi:hypothetical protein EEB14_37030 [Rhodococcus sp. WS4]|nr:hypothetical protein EEB14_37030 [Rhodococcus sp. WS4]